MIIYKNDSVLTFVISFRSRRNNFGIREWRTDIKSSGLSVYRDGIGINQLGFLIWHVLFFYSSNMQKLLKTMRAQESELET